MKAQYVIKSERAMKHAKTGEPYKHVSFYKGPIMGIAHEFTSNVFDARKFASKTLAEFYARNRGIRFDVIERVARAEVEQ